MQFSFTALTAVLLAGSAMASPLLERQSTTNVTGQAQFTSFNGGITACGDKHTDSEFVLGVDAKTFGSGDAVCGRQVRIYAPNGKTHKGTVVDSCGSGCGTNGINLSPALFKKFYSLDKGVFKATWRFL